MIRLFGQVKNCAAMAVSGGVDSMAALSFLQRSNPKLIAVYFNHGTAHGTDAEKFVTDYANTHNLPLIIGKIKRDKNADESWEEYWRLERLAFFKELQFEIATAHHLNDAVETHLFGVFHGNPEKRIGYRYNNVVRPFLLTPKDELLAWAARHKVPHIEDPSNADVSHPRNRIRHQILPEILKLNPGFVESYGRKLKTYLQENH